MNLPATCAWPADRARACTAALDAFAAAGVVAAAAAGRASRRARGRRGDAGGFLRVGPLTVNSAVRGAITIVRSRSRPKITFLELSVLEHIAELAGGAVARLRAAGRPQAVGQRRFQR